MPLTLGTVAMGITGLNEYIELVLTAVLPNAVIISSRLVMQRSHYANFHR